MEEKKLNIYEKLINIQNELKAPKNQFNSFGKYNYRSCEDILEAIKPLCKAYKSLIYISDEVTEVNGRNYVKAIVTFVDIETGETIITNSLAREEETKKGSDGSQITGASSSYARKYALNGLFCIDDTKDSDATNKGNKEPTSPINKVIPTITDAQYKNLLELARKKGVKPTDVIKVSFDKFKKQDLKTLSTTEYNYLIASLNKKKDLNNNIPKELNNF